uniref:AB hydrolase-1 domain-containing protein n=1 Tax=Anopheles culicifacies TaxID=139723 RepID=A0A182MDM7_9DIPT
MYHISYVPLYITVLLHHVHSLPYNAALLLSLSYGVAQTHYQRRRERRPSIMTNSRHQPYRAQSVVEIGVRHTHIQHQLLAIARVNDTGPSQIKLKKKYSISHFTMVQYYIRESIQFVVSYALCVFYSLRVLFGILVLFVTKPHTKFWITKERPVPPDCLKNHEYGVDKFQNANGIRIHYVEKGDPSKPLMVFVHGFPEFWYSWRHQLKEFSKDYWVVALDMRGYGDTEKPQYRYAYRIDNMTEDIRCLVRALGRQKFTLVAHDWGAVIGWHFITKHMDMIDRYIMMDGPSQKVVRKLFSTSKTQFKMSWYIFFYQMPWLPEFFVRMMDFHIFKVLFREHGGPEVIEAFKYTFSKPNGMTYPINYYRENFRFFTRKLTPPRPKTFARGLYLLGENDLYISKETGPLMQQEFENLEFRIVPGVDHFLQQHKPELVNQYMREFLSKN